MIPARAKLKSCFLHVPKSGGTALTLYLQKVLGESHVFHVGEGRYRDVPIEGLMKRYAVITGHFNLGQIPARLFESTFLFTFLREPVDRIISMYQFYKEGDLDSDHRVVINEEWSLARALDKWVRPGRCTSWSNEQTFLFSGASDPNQPPEDLLPLALRNLERFDFVGLHQHFAAGVECLGRLRGWPLTAPVPRFKTSRQRLTVADMEAGLVERVRAANACDARLYARACELWEAVQARSARLPPAAPAILPPCRVETGTQEIRFSSVNIFDRRTGGDAVVKRGHPVEVRLGIFSTLDTKDVHVGLRIHDEAGLEVYGVNMRLQDRPLSLEQGTITTVRYVFDLRLAAGAYHLSVVIRGGPGHDERVFHAIDNVSSFWCVDERPASFTGLVNLDARLEVANPYDCGDPTWWRPPKWLRSIVRGVRRSRALKLGRYIVRTIKTERWKALHYFFTGKTPARR